MNETELVKIQNWRCSVKMFDPKKIIPRATWNALEQSLVLSPSSYGLQPWKFIVVTDPSTKKILRANAWDQAQVENCSHFVVFCRLEKVTEDYVNKYITHISETRGVPVDKLGGYKSMMMGDVVKGP